MKIKSGYMLREIVGHFAVFPIGTRTVEFTGVITLNDTGAFLWKNMSEEISDEDLANKLRLEYGVDMETAKRDINEFVNALKDSNLLDTGE